MPAAFSRSSPDISSGLTGATRKIRTNAPSLVTTSPVRSTASTPSSSPASRSSPRLLRTASIMRCSTARRGRARRAGRRRGSRSSWSSSTRVSGHRAGAGEEAPFGATPAQRGAHDRPQVELGLRGDEPGDDRQPADVHPGDRRADPVDRAQPVRPREPDQDPADHRRDLPDREVPAEPKLRLQMRRRRIHDAAPVGRARLVLRRAQPRAAVARLTRSSGGRRAVDGDEAPADAEVFAGGRLGALAEPGRRPAARPRMPAP